MYPNFPPSLCISLVSGEQPPTLREEESWSAEFCEFVRCCLRKNPEERPDSTALTHDKFLVSRSLSRIDILPLLNSRASTGQTTVSANIETKNGQQHHASSSSSTIDDTLVVKQMHSLNTGTVSAPADVSAPVKDVTRPQNDANERSLDGTLVLHGTEGTVVHGTEGTVRCLSNGTGGQNRAAVSYTHLTLPTMLWV